MSSRKAPVWETVAIFASILAIWPGVFRFWAANSDRIAMEDLPLASTLHWGSPVWDVLMIAALGLMVIVAVRRVRRLRASGRGDDDMTI